MLVVRVGAAEVPVYDFRAEAGGTVFPRGGPWAVYEGVLVDDTPAELPSGVLGGQYNWSHAPIDGERRLPAYGCNTYHARVRLPDGWKGGDVPLALAYPFQFHASRVVVRNRGPAGGTFRASSGTPSCDARAEVPLHRPVFLPFSADGDVDVYVQVSNHHAMRGGLVRTPFIGPASVVARRRSMLERLDFAIVGVLGVTGVAHVAQWLLRRSQVQTAYFAALCFVMALRAIVFGHYFELADPPLLGFAAVQRLVYITIDAAVFFTIAFFDAALPRTLPRGMVRAFGVACGSVSLLVLLLDVTTFGPLIFVEQALAAVGTALVIASASVALYRDRTLYAALMLASFVVLAAAAVSDIVIDSVRTGEVFIAPYGTMGFVVVQSFAIALQNARARDDADKFGAELAARSERLVQIDALKNEFLATTSHELRTPLNGIVGLSEALLQRASVRNDREATGQLLAITDSGRRLTGLIDDILDFSRLRTRKIVLDRKPIDLRRVIAQVMLLSRSLPGTKTIDLRESSPRDLPLVFADENRLRQVLQNLVGNAIKFTEHGFVEVAAEAVGAFVEIRVRDSGIGIPSDKFEQIFETFEQLESGPARSAAGTGLGLAITRQLVELQGGTISVHSAVGLGSTFLFTVEVARDAGGAASPGRSLPAMAAVLPPPLVSFDVERSAQGDGPRWKILAVDDDAANLFVLSAQLERSTFEIVPVRDSREAVRVFRESGPFDAVLLDVMMPKVSGLEVARELRRLEPAGRCPIVFLSARTGLDDLAAAFGAGGSDFLTKPVVRTELLARLNHHLEVARAFRSNERPLDELLIAFLAEHPGPVRVRATAWHGGGDGEPSASQVVDVVRRAGAVPVFDAGDVVLVLEDIDAPRDAASDPLRVLFGEGARIVEGIGVVAHADDTNSPIGPKLRGIVVSQVLREIHES